MRNISIHPPLAGRDESIRLQLPDFPISIHPPLAGRDEAEVRLRERVGISIHPPLAGRDRGARRRDRHVYISIHPPLAGRDWRGETSRRRSGPFQSTRPLRGGTPFRPAAPQRETFQSTRPLRGGTILRGLAIDLDVFQSTRPLRGGTSSLPGIFKPNLFQSTRPLRGGTAILHKKTVQNIAYCTKSAFTLAVLSGFLALMRPFFLPNVHKFRCEPSEESLLAPRSHAYTIRTPSG